MPLIEDENGTHITPYSMPPEIKTRITKEFLDLFWTKLCEKHGQKFLEFDDDLDDYPVRFESSTYGVSDPMRDAAKELGMEWFLEYDDALPWYDWDCFMDELVTMLVKPD